MYFHGLKHFHFSQKLADYQHLLHKDGSDWNFTKIPALEKHLSVMDGEPLQQVVKEVIGLYKKNVEPNLCFFQQGNTAIR